MHKLSVQAPPKLTVEKYLVEIAKYYNVDYEPDTQVLGQDEAYAAEALIELGPGAAPPIPNKSDLAMAPQIPPGAQPTTPFQYPAPGGAGQHPPPNYPYQPAGAAPYPPPGSGGAPYPPAGATGGAMAYPPPGGAMGGPSPYPPANKPDMSKEFPSDAGEASGVLPNLGDDGPPPAYFPPDLGPSQTNPAPSSPLNPGPPSAPKNNLDLPELPSIPMDSPARGNVDFVAHLQPREFVSNILQLTANFSCNLLVSVSGNTPGDDEDDDDKKGGANDQDEDIDFDDLTKRFEALKKKK